MPTRPWLRWLVPLAAVLAIAATTLVAGNASADEKLPPRSAEQLLVDLQQAELDGFSGTVQQSADLGIPALPGMGEQGCRLLLPDLGYAHAAGRLRRPRQVEGRPAG